MMVQASTHMGISVSMRGWAIYLDTGHLSHLITYLFLVYLPMFIILICCSATPENPASCLFLMATILWGTPWPP
jgi:hypothetical protein